MRGCGVRDPSTFPHLLTPLWSGGMEPLHGCPVLRGEVTCVRGDCRRSFRKRHEVGLVHGSWTTIRSGPRLDGVSGVDSTLFVHLSVGLPLRPVSHYNG